MTTPTPHGAPELPAIDYALLAEHLGPGTANLLCVTRWYDGIDIEEPCAGTVRLLQAYARAAIQQAAGAVPEGWRLVPVEPTPAMLEASLRIFEWGWVESCPELLECGVPVEMGITQEEADHINAENIKEQAKIYSALLAASPTPPASGGSSDHLVPCAGGGVKS